MDIMVTIASESVGDPYADEWLSSTELLAGNGQRLPLAANNFA